MLSQIEQKLTSLIADRLVERTHLSVIEAPGPVPALQAGKGAVLVSLAEVSPETTFERARFKINGTQSRRILPIAFAAEVELFMQPAGATDADRANARETLLDDMALTCHRLAQDDLLDGSAFAVADPDPGFKVRAFLLENAAIRRDENSNGLSAVARYRGSGEIWPPGVVQPAGEIRAIDTVIVPLPMQIDPRDAAARPGQSVTIHVRSLGGNKLMVREPRQTQPTADRGYGIERRAAGSAGLDHRWHAGCGDRVPDHRSDAARHGRSVSSAGRRQRHTHAYGIRRHSPGGARPQTRRVSRLGGGSPGARGMKQALFYPASFTISERTSLVTGVAYDAPLDIVTFDDAAGGDEQRELAVPLLVGMDGIEVTQARLGLRCGRKLVDVADYQVRDNGNQGVFLSLPQRAQLVKVEVAYTEPIPAAGQTVRLVMRAANKAGGGFEASTPLFAAPDLGVLGKMLGTVLGGMRRDPLPDNRSLITIPALLGDAWLIQLAIGNSVKDLVPLDAKIAINRVTVAAAPANLTVTLAGAGGDVKLWNNPGLLLPEAGEQQVSFTPLAQKHLAESLKKVAKNASAVTLPVPLRFHSDSPCALDITDRALEAEYVLGPLGERPPMLELRGSATPIVLNATAGLRPTSSSLQLTVKHLGRELNAASSEPPPEAPNAGLRVNGTRFVANSMMVAPRPGQVAGSVLKIASARLHLSAAQGAEVVMEVRGDVAGGPGPVAAAQVVSQLEPDFCGWAEFELAKPLDVVTGQAPLWLVLRVTTGSVVWFMTADAEGSSRVSSDEGETWGMPDAALMPGGTLLAQLFDIIDNPAIPELRLNRGLSVLKANVLDSATRKAPLEFSCETALPAAVHEMLASTPGQGRQKTELQVFSRAVLDIVVSAQLRYDPFGARSSGG